MLQLSNITTQYQYYNSQLTTHDNVIRQLTLKQKGFIMLENSLVALVAPCYVLFLIAFAIFNYFVFVPFHSLKYYGYILLI